METIKHIAEKYNLDITQKEPIRIRISRWKEFPMLLNELGIKKAVEIGTYKGNFAEVLSILIPGIDLTVVDAWKVYKGYKDYGENDLETLAYEQTLERSKKFGFKIIKDWSTEATKQFEDESLDFVFIDGNHDFEHVVEDIGIWSKKVKKGGIVSGHDFFKNHPKNFGVFEAVPAWCAAKDISPLFVVAHDRCPSWFYVKQ